MTRAIDEAARRISNYLTTQLFINVGFGAVWSLVLFVVPNGAGGYGVPYAMLWGSLLVALRFIPYVGAWVALAFPLLFSLAVSPVEHPWLQPLLVAGIFLALEFLVGNVVEPLLFGRHAGVSPVALLVAAVFWAWLWGPIGLLLSTPLTVCLAVLGKYVPGMEIFAIFLGPEEEAEAETSYYQRLLAGDEDEAAELVQARVKDQPPEKVYDEVLLPALVLAREDAEKGILDPGRRQFVLDVTRRVVDEVVGHEHRLKLLASGKEKLTPSGELTEPRGGRTLVLACPAHGDADELALRMLALLLRDENYQVEVLSAAALTSEVIDRVREAAPAVVCVGALPPGGLARAGYLCKRLRSQFPDLKIVVGRWEQKEDFEKTTARLLEAGANRVAASLLEARREIVPLAGLDADTSEAVPANGERQRPQRPQPSGR
jgi:hypothetical protein